MTHDTRAEFLAAADAIKSSDLDRLGSVVRRSPDVLEATDPEGRTLLNLACRAATGDAAIPHRPGTVQQHAVVDFLIERGTNPSVADDDGWSPLHVAAMSGHENLATRLLTAGASRDGRLLGRRGGTPLALALFYAKTGIAELLSDPAVPDNLRHAAGIGRGLDRFFEHPANTSSPLTDQAAVGLDFYRPLLLFPEWNRILSRQEIIDEALTWAARNGRRDAMAQLVKWGANVNANPYRGTPLLWAVYSDQSAVVDWLVTHGADPNLRHDFGGSEHGKGAVALHLAAQFGSTESIERLLEAGADPTIVDEAHGGTPLDWARFSGATEAIALLE